MSELLVPVSHLSNMLVLQLNAVRTQFYRQITRGYFFRMEQLLCSTIFLFYFYGHKCCQEKQEILLKHKRKHFYLLKHRVVTQAGCGVILLRAIQNPEQCPPADPALNSKVRLENSPKTPSSLSYSVVL